MESKGDTSFMDDLDRYARAHGRITAAKKSLLEDGYSLPLASPAAIERCREVSSVVLAAIS